MRWEKTEFLLKGLYLGLLLLVAMHAPTWWDLALVGIFMAAGLALCLGTAAVQKLREGYKVRGRLAGFLLFLVLENPGLVYTGLIVGLAGGAYTTFKPEPLPPGATAPEQDWTQLVPILGGVLLGFIFLQMHQVQDRRKRMWLGFALAGILIGTAVFMMNRPDQPNLLNEDQRFMVGLLLLLGLPGFYLLTFASLVEESEVEIAAICGALGVGLAFIGPKVGQNLTFVAVLVPLTLYFVYTRRILPGLRVFKHVLRGMSYAKVDRYRQALNSFNRALQLDPNHRLAYEQLWQLHRAMDFERLKHDPETLALVNYDLCLERVGWLLLQEKPTPEQVQEAQRLLDLVSSQRPQLEPRCAYWRAVAFLHQRQLDDAARDLESLLKAPEKDTLTRRGALLQAWQLALLLHPEMNRRVGTPMLTKPDRRLEAIAAVERKLLQVPDDKDAWELKRILYPPLTEGDYNAVISGGKAAEDFDHNYVLELGTALLEDKQQWPRGCEFLRIAARGMPAKAPAIFIQIAKTHEKHGDQEGLWSNYHQALIVGRALGVKNLAADDLLSVYAVAKLLGEHAVKTGDVDTALDAFKFYSTYEKAGVETYRRLADLFEKKGDIWMALNCTEHALAYPGSSEDPDLTAKKDKYYYSVTPAELKAKWDQVNKWFDLNYCLEKTQFIMDRYNGELDNLDWAQHLIGLARTGMAAALQPKLLEARIHRLKGEIPEAIAALESIRQHKPEKFGNEAEREAWFMTHRLLGDIYLESKPDQALLCFHEYRQSDKAGADTTYKMGVAYEATGDFSRAIKCFESVMAYEDHPRFHDARDAIDRIKSGVR